MYLSAIATTPTRRRRPLYGLGCGRCRTRRRRLSGLGVAATSTARIAPWRSAIFPPQNWGSILPPVGVWPGPPRAIGPWPRECPAWGCGPGFGPIGWGGVQTSAQAPAANPPGGPPSTILRYDTAGNPVYSVPPPGQVVTGTDAAGNPIYGASSALAPATLPQPGQVIVAYDANGNPIYGTPAAGAGSQPVSVSVTAPGSTAASTYQPILDWFSQSTLITGLPNWGVAAAAAVLLTVLKSRMQRGR